MQPYSYSHDEPFGKLEDILVCFVIADEKQPGLPQMAHEGQGSRSLPVIPRRQYIHRCFPADQARSRRELIEQEGE